MTSLPKAVTTPKTPIVREMATKLGIPIIEFNTPKSENGATKSGDSQFWLALLILGILLLLGDGVLTLGKLLSHFWE